MYLVSRDADFLNPKEVPQLATGQHAGIVAIRRTASIGNQTRYLRFIAETESAQTLSGQIKHYVEMLRGICADD